MDSDARAEVYRNRLVSFFDPETLEVIPDEAGTPGFYEWTSREWDVEIELQYNRARCYDPMPGDWIGEEGRAVPASRIAGRIGVLIAKERAIGKGKRRPVQNVPRDARIFIP